MPIHLSRKHHHDGGTRNNEKDDNDIDHHDSFTNYFPIPLSSELHQHLQQLNLNMPIGVIETTLGEQFYFQRISHDEFLGHHNLAVIAEIILKNNSRLSTHIHLSGDVTINSNTGNYETIRSENSKSASSTIEDEVKSLKETCEKCINILKFRHPLLCSIATLNDSVVRKKLSKRSLNSATAREVWEREIIVTPGAIQFEIVENAVVDIEIFENEDDLLENTQSTSIQNEDDLLCHVMQRELKHSWKCLQNPGQITAMWKMLLFRTTHTQGRWLCCFSFFHALSDAQGIKHFLEEFAAIFDYVLGEQDQKTEKELEEVRIKALNDITSVTPISPMQALIELDSLRPSKQHHSRTLRRRPRKTDVAVDAELRTSSLKASASTSTNASPTSTTSERSNNEVPNNISREHHHASKDVPGLLGKWGKLVEYSKFVSRVISYNGLSPTITFPLRELFPNPSFTKVKLLKIPKQVFEQVLNISKQHHLTITCLLHGICTLAWTLSNRQLNEKSKHKTKFGFTNSLTVDFREGLLIPLGKCMKVFRSFSCTILAPVKLSLPHRSISQLHHENLGIKEDELLIHNINDHVRSNHEDEQKTTGTRSHFSHNHLSNSTGGDQIFNSHHKRHHDENRIHSSIRSLKDVILDIALQTKHHLERKYHDALATYQIMHKFLKFNISKKESFQIVMSNIGIVEPLVGKRVRFELLAASYSACGSTTGLSNIFHTNSKSGEMTISLCYSNALVEENVEKYATSIMECIKELVEDDSSCVSNHSPLSIIISSPENNHVEQKETMIHDGDAHRKLKTNPTLGSSLSTGHTLPSNNSVSCQSESASSAQLEESQSQY
ncbi:hypothetical protein C9374_006438 [Naegleria lovaniensis]|uniref:Uncharacterized protein n=1 Tax=Naegleria lovaniensis TaxID=51637 RepID=A0AA88GI74_NAELO|nr:uncharacterized protein C9374_006438 [Naegleria lovaniensis]KAG2381449.1 hypothetical protein C9374_006438 [Naegleria lovaniensis]